MILRDIGQIAALAFVALAGATAWAATDEQLAAMHTSLHTANPVTVAEVGNTDAFYYQISNPAGGQVVKLRLHLALTDYFGRQFDWSSQPVTIEPGGSATVPLAEALPAVGWYRMQLTLRAVDGAASAELPVREVALINPLESRDLPPDDDFWFGIDSRVRTPEMLKLLAQMGVDIVRFGTWANVYTHEGELDFTEFDQTIEALQEHGLQALYSITFSPGFAVKNEWRGKGHPSRLPPDPEKLKASLRDVIAHTKAKGLFIYDLWNEPDHAGFWRGSVEEYLEFLRVASQSIHEVQPEAVVLSGGIASLHDKRFHQRKGMNEEILTEGAKWYDAISYHEHGPFDAFASAIDGPLAIYRKQMDEPKPLWLTETGFQGDDHEKARVLVQKFTFARARNADGFIWFVLAEPGEFDGYNIIGKQWDPTPVIPAYAQMARMMRGKTFQREIDGPEASSAAVYVFRGQGQTLLVSWAGGAATHQAVVEVDDPTAAQAFDLMGAPLDLERADGRVSLPAGGTPSYLLVDGEAQVSGFEPIQPLAQFAFGQMQATSITEGVEVSALHASGWSGQAADDDDPRMTVSASGHPNAVFFGDADSKQLTFTIRPEPGVTINPQSIGFWGNAGTSTRVTLSYQVAGREPVQVGMRQLRNLGIPRVKGEYYRFLLPELRDVTQPVQFTLSVSDEERTVLKLDDLRVDGTVRR